MYFEVYQEKQKAAGIMSPATDQWRWRLRAANHELIASGESYKNKADCLHAIELIKNTTDSTPIKFL